MTWLLALWLAVPPEIVAAVERIESHGVWWTVSHSGCIGVMQVCPQYSHAPWPLLFLPPVNRYYGARELRYWHRRAHGDWSLALAAYRCGNAGLRGECGTAYADTVLRMAKQARIRRHGNSAHP